MKSTRTSITLAYDERQEIQPGVWENKLTEVTVKAQQEQIFQRRQDQLLLEGFVITARFLVREEHVQNDLKYVIWKGDKYKVNQVIKGIVNHFCVIEIGELI